MVAASSGFLEEHGGGVGLISAQAIDEPIYCRMLFSFVFSLLQELETTVVAIRRRKSIENPRLAIRLAIRLARAATESDLSTGDSMEFSLSLNGTICDSRQMDANRIRRSQKGR